MGRIYRPNVDAVAVTQPQDLIQISGAAGKMLRILRRWVYCVDTTLPPGQNLRLRERFLPATVTNGSGGTSVSGASVPKADPGDANASFTVLFNSTTKASTSGTAIQWGAYGCHVFNGFDDLNEAPFPIGPGEAWVFELLSTVQPTVTLSCGVTVEEIGG